MAAVVLFSAFPLAVRFLLTSLSAVCFPYTPHPLISSGLPGVRGKDPVPPPIHPHSHRCRDRPRTFPPLVTGRGKLLSPFLVHQTTRRSASQKALHVGFWVSGLGCAPFWSSCLIWLQCSQLSGGSGGPTGKLPRRLDRTGRNFLLRPVLGHFRTAVLSKDHGPHKVRHYYAILIKGPQGTVP